MSSCCDEREGQLLRLLMLQIIVTLEGEWTQPAVGALLLGQGGVGAVARDL